MKKKSPKTKKIIDKKKTILGVLALVLLVIVFLFGRLIYLKLNPVYRIKIYLFLLAGGLVSLLFGVHRWVFGQKNGQPGPNRLIRPAFEGWR